MISKALWHISEDQSEIQEQAFDQQQGVVVQSEYSLISIGSERLVALGQVPIPLYEQMKVPYMAGDFSFPVKYGYSLVGTLENGKRAHLLHPHQDTCLVAEEALFYVPEGVPAKRAALASNLETALNAIWDGNVQTGDAVLVVGFGLVGSLIARLVSMIPATRLLVADVDPAKLKLARDMGFAAKHPSEVEEVFDMAYHTSATGAGLQLAVDRTGFEGKIVELSWYGNRSTVLELGSSFHIERKQIISSQVSNLSAERRSRWGYKRRKQVVFRLLEDAVFDEHITEVVPFAALPDFFNALRFEGIQPLGCVVAY